MIIEQTSKGGANLVLVGDVFVTQVSNEPHQMGLKADDGVRVDLPCAQHV